LISQFGFTAANKCDDADFYWGDKFELNLTKTDYVISAYFDDIDELRIGVKDDGKSILNASVIIHTNDLEPDWLIRKKYSYINVTSTNQIAVLIGQIKDDVFDEKLKGSILNTII
jgi:hypothetical protein